MRPAFKPVFFYIYFLIFVRIDIHIMKRISAILLSLLSAFTMSAETVPLELARSAAEKILSSASTRSGIKLTLVNSSDISSTRSGEEPAYYIFNSSAGGFAIISASDAAHPVLAYSPEGSFSIDPSMPESLSGWLAQYKSQIDECRRNGDQATAEVKNEWAALLKVNAAASTTVVDLKTPEWGQGDPFNRKCPKIGTDATLVGCTAVAIAEVMSYYGHPESGSGTLPSYITDETQITIPALPLGEKYKWGDMLPKYKGVSFTAAQADAVSTLCYHIAVMAQANFGVSATGASLDQSIPRLAEYMQYDKGTAKYAKSYLSGDEWKSMLKAEVDAGRPVLMSGTSSAGGSHAFILEGYDSADRFLMNWGWNGTSNGFYLLSALGSYTLSQVAHIGIRPDAGGARVSSLQMKGGSNTAGTKFAGIEYYKGNIYKDSTFYVRVGKISNNGDSTFKGYFNLAIVDKKGSVKQWRTTSGIGVLNVTSGFYAWDSLSFTVGRNITIEQGDCIQAFYKVSGTSQWKPVYYSLDEADGVCGKMPCFVSDYCSMEFDKTTKILSVHFFPSEWSYCSITPSVTVKTYDKAKGLLQFDTSRMEKGTYTLTLKFSGVTNTAGTKNYKQSATVKFTL